MTLSVFIEVSGKNFLVGHIAGENSLDAKFSYDPNYMSNPASRPISLSLPFEDSPFSPDRTRCFFDGLLPEGYTRRCIAEEICLDPQDYLAILEHLGNECLGAIQILREDTAAPTATYQKMTSGQLRQFAMEGVAESAFLVTKSHLSLTGASGKAGLYYKEDSDKWYLPLGTAPSTHIVKQSHVRLAQIVANEQLCLLTAKKLGIQTPESFPILLDGQEDNNILFATKRFDRVMAPSARVLDGLLMPLRLHQEDFAQALGIASSFKYEKSGDDYLPRLFDILRMYSANPLEDQLRLWDICVFNYLIGNTDNHIKNLSLLYSEDLKSIRLAPAYDLLCTLIYESCTDEMALGIDGVHQIYHITRENFRNEANKIRLAPGMAMQRFDRIQAEFEGSLIQAAEEVCAQGLPQATDIAEEILKIYRGRF